jgi:hypothetical protein
VLPLVYTYARVADDDNVFNSDNTHMTTPPATPPTGDLRREFACVRA